MGSPIQKALRWNLQILLYFLIVVDTVVLLNLPGQGLSVVWCPGIQAVKRFLLRETTCEALIILVLALEFVVDGHGSNTLHKTQFMHA